MPRFVSRRGFYTAAALSGVTLLGVNWALATPDSPPARVYATNGVTAGAHSHSLAAASTAAFGGGLFAENLFDPAPVGAVAAGDPYQDGSDGAAFDVLDEPVPADPDAVPGAEATETVLRCAYRPHPSRVQAIYEFLKANAADGVDVSLRSVFEETGEVARQVTYVATVQRTPRQVGSGEAVYEDRQVMKPVSADGQAVVHELVVVAPPETQRAVGAFLHLALSSEPASQPATQHPVADDVENKFSSGGRPTFEPSPAFHDSQPYRGGFSEPPAGDLGPPSGDLGPPSGDLPADGFADPLPADFEPRETQPAGAPRG